METINLLISSVLQVLLALFIPFIWWLLFFRKKEKFFKWLGLKKANIKNKKSFSTAFVFITLFSLIVGFATKKIIGNDGLATAQFTILNFSTIIRILIWSIVQTGLSEEILFRGFILKRVSNKFGFVVGNTVQAILFGLMHGAVLIGIIGLPKALIAIAFTGVLGWLMGYLNEKQADGSIVPSWALHAISNIFSSIISII